MSRHIFVDDTDPAIQYTGGWKVITGLNTDQAPTAARGHTPYYGTLHTPDISASSSQWGISYTFEGKGFIAYFQTISTDAIVSCTVDGKEQLRGTTLGGGAHCVWDGMTLQPGPHKLEIIVKSVQDKALFDGLEYFTDNPPSGVDQIASYSSSGVQGSDVLKAPGDKLDFEFTGSSLAVYVSYSTTQDALDKGPSSLQYTIDGGSPVKFTLRNPANAANPQIYPQLLIQTPKLSSAKHNFHLEFLGPGTGERSFFSLSQFIVQNSNIPGLNLEVVPSGSNIDNSGNGGNGGNGGTQVTQKPSTSSTTSSGVSSSSLISSSASSSSSSDTASVGSSSTQSFSSGSTTGTHAVSSSQSTSSSSPLNPNSGSTPSDSIEPSNEHHKSDKTPIIAGCVGAAVALILALLVLFFVRRRRATRRNAKNMEIDDNLSAYPFSDRTTYANEKGKQREHEVEQTDSEPGSEPTTAATNRPQAVVYRVHEDAGEAIDPEPESEQVVIDLPPTYNTIRPAQTRSIQGPRPQTVIGPRRLPSLDAKDGLP